MPSTDTSFPITPGLISGLRLLREAWDCARQMDRSAWEFALEIDSLRAAGLSHTDLRWLIGKGYTEHAVETTRPTEGPRRFRPVRSMTLPMRTCFILTAAGAQFADQTFAAQDTAHYLPPTATGATQAAERLAREEAGGGRSFKNQGGSHGLQPDSGTTADVQTASDVRGGQGGTHGSQLDSTTPSAAHTLPPFVRGGQRGADLPPAAQPLALLHSAVPQHHAPHFPSPALPRTPSPSMGEGEGGGDRGAGFQPVPATPPKRSPRIPTWDATLHELRLGRRVVKTFNHRPAPAQELILTVFEEEGWPPTIDDPLPAAHGVESKRRLAQTVSNLNRAQRPYLIHFSVINGQTIRWTLKPPAKAKRPKSRAKSRRKRK